METESHMSLAQGNHNDPLYHLTIPTQASKSWRYNYDHQESNLRFLKQGDAQIHRQRSLSPSKLAFLMERLVAPTKSFIEKARAKTRFSHVHILHDNDPKFRPNHTVTHKELCPVVERLSVPTAASTAWRQDYDCQRVNLDYLISIDPCIGSRSISRVSTNPSRIRSRSKKLSVSDLLMDNQNGQKSRAESPSKQTVASRPRTVSPEELHHIVERITKPTISSSGGIDLSLKKSGQRRSRSLNSSPNHPLTI